MEQEGTEAQREEQHRSRERGRPRGGKIQPKRLHVLRNPLKLAFKPWWEEPEPWTLKACKRHIEWCHIDKKYPEERHRNHRYGGFANLTYCLDADFVERCIQVYQHLYCTPKVPRNEVPLFICRMAYAELYLNKRVDWRSIQNTKKVTVPTDPDIPWVRKYPGQGLGKITGKATDRVLHYDTAESEEDPDSDGDRNHNHGDRGRKRSRILPGTAPERQQNNAGESSDEEMDGAGTSASAPVIFHIVENPQNPETVIGGASGNEVDEEVEEAEGLESELRRKDKVIADLEATIRSLKLDSTAKDLVITNLRNELQWHQPVPVVRPVMEEVNNDYINNVVEVVTAGVLDDIRTPRRRERPAIALPPVGQLAQLHVDRDGPRAEDSLSFTATADSDESNALRTANEILRGRVLALSKQYYRWKVACILNVDRNRQMALELKKIGMEYQQSNIQRSFGVTSWAHPDELYPDDLPQVRGRIDWSQLDFDHKNAMSCHDLQGDPTKRSRQLWQQPAKWLLDAQRCSVCQNEFGPEGAWALGSCQHMFHPMCLITGALVRRFCPECHAPYHKRLYDMFGLTPHMPVSHERNPDNTPEFKSQWGEDLIWSWRAGTHSGYMSNVSSSFGWEENHELIVEVCYKLIGVGPQNAGRRNFFFQTLNGYWDSKKKRFQFGEHPEKKLWDKDGNLVTDVTGQVDISVRSAIQMSVSEWKEIWKAEAVDYLLDVHSPETRRTLELLQNLQMLQVLIEADGPFRRTRARRNIYASDEAGPSGTANVDDVDDA